MNEEKEKNRKLEKVIVKEENVIGKLLRSHHLTTKLSL